MLSITLVIFLSGSHLLFASFFLNWGIMLGWKVNIFSLFSPSFLPQHPQTVTLCPLKWPNPFLLPAPNLPRPWELSAQLRLIFSYSWVVIIVCILSWLLASFPSACCCLQLSYFTSLLLFSLLRLPLCSWGLCFHSALHLTLAVVLTIGSFTISSSLRRPH